MSSILFNHRPMDARVKPRSGPAVRAPLELRASELPLRALRGFEEGRIVEVFGDVHQVDVAVGPV